MKGDSYPLLADEAWLRARYETDGLSCTQIAGLVGCHTNSVLARLRRFGVPRRSPHTHHGAVTKAERKGDGRGYVLVLRPDHPAADRNGYVTEHRLVAEASLGRLLAPGELVHHHNRIRDDNRPENLIVTPNTSAHQTIHSREARPERMLLRRRGWLAERLAEGLSYREIGELAGCSEVAVLKWCRIHGLPPSKRKNQYA